jgi:hypothetical protein
LKPAIDGGGELVARGEAEVGMYLLSEVQTVKGVTVAGLLPAALQNFVVYGSAIPVSASAADGAASFVTAYLGHRNIQHTVRYTEMSPTRFKDFWRR